MQYIAGVDEAGRGPLAGPVVAAAVIFPQGVWIPGVDDSKKVPQSRREELFLKIQDQALSIGVGIVDHIVVDAINVREASLLAMKSAISELTIEPDLLLIDGNYFRDSPMSFKTIVHGDAKVFSIAAASIVAKVIRDRFMNGLHHRYPQYGFDHNKGYATKQHIRAIERFGLCDIHRRTFHVRHVA